MPDQGLYLEYRKSSYGSVMRYTILKWAKDLKTFTTNLQMATSTPNDAPGHSSSKRYYHHSHMSEGKKTNNTKCWQRHVATGMLVSHRWECKMTQPLWRIFLCFTVLDTCSQYTPAITRFGTHSRETETYPRTEWKLSPRGSC